MNRYRGLAAAAAIFALSMWAVPALAADTAQEAAFLRTVDRRNSAYVVTGDLSRFAGTHVAYTCAVDAIVRPGVMLGQCGAEAEPIDLFVELPTAKLHAGDRLRILGYMDRPATWTDVSGHSVYYAFLKAVFVDRLR